MIGELFMPKDEALVKEKRSVTVIIPVYSRVKLLKETLQSIYNQSGDFNLKVILVDDCSPKPIKPLLLSEFPKIKFIRNEKNLGSGLSRNIALSLVKSEYVAFLDSDDLWKSNFLNESLNELRKGSVNATVVFSSPLLSANLPMKFKLKIKLLSLIRDIFQIIFCIFNNFDVPKSAFYLCQLSHMVFKTKSIKKYKFDVNYIYGGEDWKFIIEVMDKIRIKIIPKRLAYYRYHLKGTTMMKKNLKRKWNSYNQLFDELSRRNIKGLMVELFRKYIDTFK